MFSWYLHSFNFIIFIHFFICFLYFCRPFITPQILVFRLGHRILQKATCWKFTTTIRKWSKVRASCFVVWLSNLYKISSLHNSVRWKSVFFIVNLNTIFPFLDILWLNYKFYKKWFHDQLLRLKRLNTRWSPDTRCTHGKREKRQFQSHS